MMLFLQLLISTALAADVPPRESSVPVRVHGASTEAAYHALMPGKPLSFNTIGPGKWSVEIRQRATTPATQAKGTVLVLGNGKHRIMAIELKAGTEPSTRVDDVRGGLATEAERAVITVPAAGRFLTLQLSPGTSDTLVRLFTREELPPESPTASVPDKASEPAAPIAQKPEPKAEPPAPAKRPRREPRLNLGTGISMGLGIPARGSKAVGYLGADFRYPVYKKLISAGASVGWYRVAVDESITVADPHLGHTTVSAQWRTNVVPIVARGLAHSPVTIGPVRPMAGLGLGLFIANRSEGNYATTQVGLGPELLAGVDYDLGHLGTFGGNMTWSEARMFLGHQGADGMPVRETVAHTRLNLCWFHTF